MILAVKKSIFWKTVRPKNLTSAQWLNESTVPIPKNQATRQTTTIDALREEPLSTAQATAGSAIEMDDVQEATTTNKKKTVPISTPPGKPPKAIGNDSNNKLGPTVGGNPFENTIEKIITPAISAITVSNVAAINTVLPMCDFSGK